MASVLLMYLASAFLLLLSAFVIFRVLVRRDYLRSRRLSPTSTLLESVFWGPVFAFPYIYNPPSWPVFWDFDPGEALGIQYLGSALIVLGMIGVLVIMVTLGFRRSIGQEVSTLQARGPYAISRNPQIVVGFLIFLGIGLRWPSWYAIGWVGLAAACLHMMVLTEEEHLRNVFGAQYTAYCDRVPRYLGLRSKEHLAAG